MNLAIFDIDGTLTDRDSTEIYPEMVRLIRSLAAQGVKIALATNQGGPACHDAGWEFSANFPSYEQIQERLTKIKANVENLASQEIGLFVCYIYRTKTGQVLLPRELRQYLFDLNIATAESDDPRVQGDSFIPGTARPGWRKPEPGMIWAAMEWAGATPADTTVYGDSDDDEGAARAAGCRFIKV